MAMLTRCRINTYCKFCLAEGKQKVPCKWRAKYAPRFKLFDHKKHYACDEHKDLIEDTDPDGSRYTQAQWEKMQPKTKPARDEYMTEADYQTWGRL